jgi:hypothetical protein
MVLQERMMELLGKGDKSLCRYVVNYDNISAFLETDSAI